MKLNRPSRTWNDHDLNGRLRHARNDVRHSASEPSLSGTLEACTPIPTEEPVEAVVAEVVAPSVPLTTIIETEPAERPVHETQAYEPNPFTAPTVAEPAVEPWTPEVPATPAPVLAAAPVPTTAPAVAAAPAVPVASTPTPNLAPTDDVFALLVERLQESRSGVEVLLGASLEAVAAARDEVGRHRAHAEAEAAAIVAQARAEAEQIRTTALADVEDARRRLARFSAEIESLAGELHGRHLG